MNLKNFDRVTYLIGISALIVFLPMIGYMFGWAFTIEFETIQLVFADQLSEGHNYIVTISDSIGTADHLK